jgi:hypothetical protein
MQAGIVATSVFIVLGTSVGCSSNENGPTSDTFDLHDGATDGSIPDRTFVDAGEPPEPPVGDWFLCLDHQCSVISYNGWRFESDNTVKWLYGVPPSLEAEENYCYTKTEQLNLTYTYSGNTLQLTHNWNAQQLTYLADFKGDIGSWTEMGTTKKVQLRRVWPPRTSGPCANRSPWICPKKKLTDFPGTSCSWTWHCDNGSYTLDCSLDKVSGSYICTCLDAQKNNLGKFSTADPCQSNGMELANAKCNLEIWEPPISTPP